MLADVPTDKYPAADVTNCAREPIHIPGSIQPHGYLLALSLDGSRILQISKNLESLLGRPSEVLLSRTPDDLFGRQLSEMISCYLDGNLSRERPAFLGRINVPDLHEDRIFNVLAHQTDGGIVIELESGLVSQSESNISFGMHPLLDTFTIRAEVTHEVEKLGKLVCEVIRDLTGFDRALVYEFDADWNGNVIGEARNERLPSYLYHRFPASDIPAQARELYRVNRLRIIPDSTYEPVPLVPAVNPLTGQPLNMTFSTLRSVSPVHVEYMRNMETAASMSVSIIRDGKLWGLISCHHREPKTVSFPIRGTCDLIARAFSLRLSAIEHRRILERRAAVRASFANLVAMMADRGDYAAALSEHPDDLLALADAEGAAVLSDDHCILLGKTPSEAQVREIAAWLREKSNDEIFSTNSLADIFPPARAFKETGSGLLAISISKLHPSFLMWFRPEVVQTVQWGGNPHKAAELKDPQQLLHPRKSFETWLETVRDRALSWDTGEIEGAIELRNAIVGTVLKRAEELAELNAELSRSNKELEAFSYSVSHDLRAPLRHIVGYAEMLKDVAGDRLSSNEMRYLANIIESSEYAGKLVDKLLGYSRLGRAELQISKVDMKTLAAELQADVMRDAPGRKIKWHVHELPPVNADLMMLRMALRDLLANAVKYTRNKEEAIIELGVKDEPHETTFWVKDNGVGFDMAYADKLFGVFQRLHRWEEYEGTGIGLANVRRVIERHSGRTWAHGQENHGATFYFALPKPTE